MKPESADSLPKMLPGTVHAQRVRCGRPNCRCARGALHGPYYYRFWRQGRRLRKAYVRRADLVRVLAACQARRLARLEELAGWHEWRQLAASLMEAQQG